MEQEEQGLYHSAVELIKNGIHEAGVALRL